MRISEVFVPGGQPRVTYVPRAELELEERVRDYLEEGHRLLSLAGPTKCGKTVLVRSVVPNAVWVSGGNTQTAEAFWATIVDFLGAFPTETKERTGEETTADGVTAKVGVDYVVVAGADLETTTGSARGKRQSFERTRRNETMAIEKLLASDRLLVIDDFHYIPPDIQKTLVRALKQPIFEGLRVILAAVAHRAADAVRVESEMTGRVEHLIIPSWSRVDLGEIAKRGFHALNVRRRPGSPNIGRDLSFNAFGSPHLMQDLCLQICKANGLRETSPEPAVFTFPENRAQFYRGRSTDMARVAFDLLAQGPRQRTDRKQRHLKTGEVTDIYGAVLVAIADAGCQPSTPLKTLLDSMKKVLKDTPPQRQEVVRVLEKMTEVARLKVPGDLVFEYDSAYEVLYLPDPFFAYFLRWGGLEWEIKKPTRRGSRGGRRRKEHYTD